MGTLYICAEALQLQQQQLQQMQFKAQLKLNRECALWSEVGWE